MEDSPLALAETLPDRQVFFPLTVGEKAPPPLTDLHACAGYDLQGNTYWEFRLTRGTEGSERWRRIVHYPRSAHYSSVKVSPLWHQWLRYTRQDPPSLDEQQREVVRQQRIKSLAEAADARWEAKPRVMDAPAAPTGQPLPSLDTGGVREEVAQGDRHAATQREGQAVKEEQDPWAKAKAQAPGEKWQPTAWSPTPSRKR